MNNLLNLFGLYRYAEMDADTKNEISHRGKALQALKQFFSDPQPLPVKRLKET